MKVVTAELKADGLTQSITPSKNLFCIALRPYLVKYGSPAGTLKVQVLSDADVLLAESDTMDCVDISEADYFHGFIRFYVSIGLTKDVTYKIKLVGEDGYSFSDSDYIGWGNTFESGPYAHDYLATNSFYKPLKLEVWHRKTK